MALPSRPNARLGLPSNPAPHTRSRSLVASTRVGLAPTDRPNSSASEPVPTRTFSPPPLPRNGGPSQLRPQRSVGSLSVRSRAQSMERGRERQRPPLPPPPPMPPMVPLPPLPSLPEAKQVLKRVESSDSDIMGYYTGDFTERKNSSTSISSTSSSSSSGSGSSYSSLDFSAIEVPNEDDNHEPHGYVSQVPAGFGSSLWSRVAAAAGNLSVSVSKAWATNVPKLGGEGSDLVIQFQ